MKKLYTVWSCMLLAALMVPGSLFAQEVEQMQMTRHHTSAPLHSMEMPDTPQGPVAPFAVPNKFIKFGSMKNAAMETLSSEGDDILQTQDGSGYANIRKSFEGANDDDNAAVLGFRVVPPDTEGDVGPKHYVQWINSVAEIFDKRGNTIMGPFPGNYFFQGLGGICEETNNGDPIVLYDEGADRWNVSQFALDFANNNFAMCIAVSTSGDPTGTYNQYELNFGSVFPDYPKLGIWGDSYTLTTRNFNDPTGFNQSAIAMDRQAMLDGDAVVNAVSVRLPRFFFEDGILPMDSDTPGITGPAMFGGHTAFGSSRGDRNQVFRLYAIDVDWADPASASFIILPVLDIPDYNISAAPYVQQPNGQVLDDLETFTMHRAQVRDFGTHRTIVANHTVRAKGDAAGVRWYEFRNYGDGWMIHQAGTYSPKNADDRWMASIAMNGSGDIALGYSVSSSTTYPSIYITGQTSDYSGTGVMNVAETLVQAGGGSQEDASRWGDYSKVSVDPRDDKTFWFTTEYYEETAGFDFKTRIAAFRLSSGGSHLADGGAANINAADQLIASDVPTEFAVEQNYPNPFNPTTMINFAVPEAGHVSVKVYNMLGQEVASLVNEVRDAGNHTVSFDAAGLTAGVYLYVMESGNFSETRRMTLLK
ncbi:MAG: T9SS type A sorting domain-containing protein [Rhodothermaceae bacterium]|nr:T9SS type A sorting domain-containing protein [Rhodothermaceae bacterium]